MSMMLVLVHTALFPSIGRFFATLRNFKIDFKTILVVIAAIKNAQYLSFNRNVHKLHFIENLSFTACLECLAV